MAHQGSQRPRPQFGVTKDFERESQNHEKIRDDRVLEKNDEVGFTADLKENPHGQAVRDEPGKEQDGVEQWEENLGDLVVSAAQGAGPRGEGGIDRGGVDTRHVHAPGYPVESEGNECLR